jgi:hypothetical protein
MLCGLWVSQYSGNVVDTRLPFQGGHCHRLHVSFRVQGYQPLLPFYEQLSQGWQCQVGCCLPWQYVLDSGGSQTLHQFWNGGGCPQLKVIGGNYTRWGGNLWQESRCQVVPGVNQDWNGAKTDPNRSDAPLHVYRKGPVWDLHVACAHVWE